MTKPLDPTEKQRRQDERNALKAAEAEGKTAAQAMAELQRKRVDEEKAKIAAEDAAKEPEIEAQRQRDREAHERNMAELREREAIAEQNRARIAEAEASKKEEEKAAKAAQPRAPRKSTRTRVNGYARCEGSTVNVEETGLTLEGGKVLRDEDPWNYRQKRVMCPSCKHKVGVSPFGKRKDPQPVGYRIDTHYKKS